MTKLSYILFICFLSIATLTATAQKDKNTKLKAEIEALNAKMVKASLAMDMETSSSFYTDDVIHMPNYSPMLKGKKPMLAQQKESHEAGYVMKAMKFDIQELIPTDDMIIEIGFYEVSMTIPMMPEDVTDKGKYVTIWERQKDGSLKIKLEIWNTDKSPMADMQE